MNLLRRAWAFLVRDFKSEASYRLHFGMQLLGLSWTLLLFYFVSRLVGEGVPELQAYGGSWFSFVVLGYAPLEYLRVGVIAFSSRLREAQSFGTLEALLVTRADIPTIVFGSAAYAYAWSTVRALLFLAAGAGSLGATDVDVLAVFTFMGLSVIAFGALGVLSAAFVMVFKKGDPVSLLLFGTSTIFSGLLFPTEVLGRWEAVSRVLPLTYAMDGTRMAIQGQGLLDQWPRALVLLGFVVVLVPLAGLSFRWAVARARRDGTLSHY